MVRRRGVRGSYRLVLPGERARMVLRFREGARVGDVVAEFGVPRSSAQRIRDEAALMRRRVMCSPDRLSFEERERIFVGIWRGESDSEIARSLGRHRSTIGREIRRCGERRHYRPLKAERKARLLAQRPKPTKLSGSTRLLAAVEEGLARRWSPQQISARLKVDHPDDEGMRISHETICQSLYVQARGELRRQLAANLRTGRKTRRSHGRADARKGIPEMIPIAERPPEVDDRTVPGHWEGDLIIGAKGKSR
jgi:IS30 family transposase